LDLWDCWELWEGIFFSFEFIEVETSSRFNNIPSSQSDQSHASQKSWFRQSTGLLSELGFMGLLGILSELGFVGRNIFFF